MKTNFQVFAPVANGGGQMGDDEPCTSGLLESPGPLDPWPPGTSDPAPQTLRPYTPVLLPHGSSDPQHLQTP